jgi:oligopeptide/dipeptide ABC transporter ATP-binding protein
MYTGEVVEHGTVYQVLKEAKHPYTQGLLNSIPGTAKKGQRLNVIKGSVPNPLKLPKGCTFAPRCPHVMDICWRQSPRLLDVGRNHLVHCWLYQQSSSAAFEQHLVPEVRLGETQTPFSASAESTSVPDAPARVNEFAVSASVTVEESVLNAPTLPGTTLSSEASGSLDAEATTGDDQ